MKEEKKSKKGDVFKKDKIMEKLKNFNSSINYIKLQIIQSKDLDHLDELNQSLLEADKRKDVFINQNKDHIEVNNLTIELRKCYVTRRS